VPLRRRVQPDTSVREGDGPGTHWDDGEGMHSWEASKGRHL